MRRRQWWMVAGAVLVAGGATVALGVPALVRSQVDRAAAPFGLVVRVDEVSVGRRGIWLSGVGLQLGDGRLLQGEIDHVEVQLGAAGVNGVVVHGGDLRVRGSREELIKALRDRRVSEEAGPARGPSRRIRGDGVFVEWRTEEHLATVWGLSFQREENGWRIAADRVEGVVPQGVITVTDAAARIDGGGVLRGVQAGGTRAVVFLDRLFGDASGAQMVDGSATFVGGDPGVAVPQKAPLAAEGPTEDGPGPLADVRGAALALFGLDPGRGARMRARVADFAGVAGRRVPEGAVLDLEGVQLELRKGRNGMNLGPARMRLAREENQLRFSFLPGLAAATPQPLELTAHVPLGEGPTELHVEGGPVTLAAIGVREGDLGLRDVGHAEVRLEAKVRLSDDGNALSFRSTGAASGISVAHRTLGPDTLSDIEVGWGLSGSLALDGSQWVVDSGELSLGGVRAQISGRIDRSVERTVVRGQMDVPLAACAEMLSSLPRNLVPFADRIDLTGTFSWKTSLSLDTSRLAEMALQWRMNDDCVFEAVPSDLSPERFRGPFVLQVPDADGAFMDLETGPGTERWVPLARVSPFLEAAVLVAEDGRFWSHQGFDQRAIESSIRENVQQGRFTRGASTISMQLAKNLYLTREKTLSRKVQEALLTMLLEQTLRKDEILELYFNVVELGPGVFGIQQASEYYFRSHPSALSVSQAFFLASILPSPNRQYFDAEGSLKPHWHRLVRRLMGIAKERGRITQDQLEQGLEQEVRLGVPHEGPDDGAMDTSSEDGPLLPRTGRPWGE